MTTDLTKPMSSIPGLEGVMPEDLTIPRLKIVQPVSVESTADGVAFSSIVNSVTKEVIAKGTKTGAGIVVISIMSNKSRLYFKPIKEGGGLLCRSNDNRTGVGEPGGDCASCQFSEWANDKDGKGIAPACDELLNVFCLVRGYDFPIPVTASFARTSTPAGKKLVNLFYFACQNAQKSPWNFAFNLETEIKSKDTNTWAQFKVSNLEDLKLAMATKEEAALGEKFYRMIKDAATVQVHTDETEMEEEADNIKNEAKASEDKRPNKEPEPEDEPTDNDKPPF